MNILVSMSLKFSHAIIMQVKSAIIWRKTNKLTESYYALELKVLDIFL